MSDLDNLKQEIEKIKARNKKVEADKAWETSPERKLAVAFLTYIVVLLFFLVTKSPKPFLSALIPTIGFLLSTLSIDALKSWWINKRK